MGQFKACICDGNVAALRVSGVPSISQMLEAWQTVFFEYCDLLENPSLKEQILTPLRLEFDKRSLELITAWLKIVKVYKSAEICKALEEIFPVRFNMEDEMDYRCAIAEVQAELISLAFDVKIREAELVAKAKQGNKGTGVDHKYFAKIFFRINNYAKREAVNDMTSVANYVVALKDYEDYLETIKTA